MEGRVEGREEGGDRGWTAPLWFNQGQAPAQRPGPGSETGTWFISGWTRIILVSLALVFILNRFNPQQRSFECVGVTVEIDGGVLSGG